MRAPDGPRSWTARVREAAEGALPPEKLLPDRQPAYVASWVYVFGVTTLAALIVLVASGTVLSLEGPDWWHTSAVGHFFNSVHFWGVQMFFFAMVVHLWGKFLMGAWRGRRRATWVVGALTLLVAIGTGLTGYVLQQNFASQWISTQAKDGFNAVGIGAFFNVLNLGQMLTLHVLLMPAAVVLLTILHLLQVRHRGVVPPFDAADEHLGPEEAER
ncbi:MAG TPA: cytochrome b N-terminal domain-containing protein [Actinomycetota bacterium]